MSTGHLWLIGLMLIAGVIGGTANHLTRADGFDEKTPYIANLIVSILAAFVTPLFLSLAKSTLLDQLIANQESGRSVGADVFVFFGFCLVAAFSARVFVRNLTDTVLNLKQSQQRLKDKVDDLEGDVGEIEGELEPGVSPEEEGVTTPPDQTPAVPTRRVALRPNQEHMLRALVTRPFTWRSVAGVRKEVGLSRETATVVLEDLVRAQLADKKPSKSGNWLYRATAGGRAAIGLSPLLEGRPKPE